MKMLELNFISDDLIPKVVRYVKDAVDSFYLAKDIEGIRDVRKNRDGDR